jgi:hypothetical protein
MNELASRLSEADARLLTDEIKSTTEKLYALLLRAHEGEAWAALGYASWRDYAMTEFQMSQSKAYHLLDLGRAIRVLEADGPVERLPNERQTRELAMLLPEPARLREVWDLAVAHAGDKVTAETVRAAREVVIASVVSTTNETPRRLDELERVISDASATGSPWADEVGRSCLRSGLAKEIKRYQDRSRVLFAHLGREIPTPRVQSIRRTGEAGEAVDVREPVEGWTFAEIRAKQAEAAGMRQTYADRVAFYGRLLALEQRCPAASTPVEAATSLGLSIDEHVAREAAQ